MELERAIDTAAEAVGLQSLKNLQRHVIRSFVTGNDVFVSLPTGFGKPYCFVLLPLVFDNFLGSQGSIILCVSPLTSLMLEQREKYSTRTLCTSAALNCPVAEEILNNAVYCSRAL